MFHQSLGPSFGEGSDSPPLSLGTDPAPELPEQRALIQLLGDILKGPSNLKACSYFAPTWPGFHILPTPRCSGAAAREALPEIRPCCWSTSWLSSGLRCCWKCPAGAMCDVPLTSIHPPACASKALELRGKQNPRFRRLKSPSFSFRLGKTFWGVVIPGSSNACRSLGGFFSQGFQVDHSVLGSIRASLAQRAQKPSLTCRKFVWSHDLVWPRM